MIRSQNPSFDLRYRLVQTALEQGIPAAGRLFSCSRNTVRKWLRSYQQEGKPGLELIPFGLPRFQFTAHIVPEETLWLASSAVNDSTYALLFADRLLAHLARCGVDLRPLVVQTDNGSKFGGAWNRRHGLPPFTKLVEQKYGCRQHRFHPPHRSTYTSDVKAVHGIMERGFYELERFRGSLSAFLGQAYSYQLYFNLVRRTSAKGGGTPEQLRHARAPTVSPQVCLLPPVMLSSLDAQDLPLPLQVSEGHHVRGYLKTPSPLLMTQGCWGSHMTSITSGGPI